MTSRPSSPSFDFPNGVPSTRRARRPNVKNEPVGFLCVNKLMNKAIGKVLTLARGREQSRNWARNNKAKKKETDNSYYQKNKQKIISRSSKWNKDNKIKRNTRLRTWANNYMKEKKATDPAFHLRCKLRSRLYTVLKRTSSSKADDISKLSGCSPRVLNEYITGLVPECVDHSDVQVDHIFPLSMFDMKSTQQQRMSCHWSNLQPLTSKENNNKKQKLPTKEMASRVEQWAWPPGITEDMLPDIYEGWSTPLRM